MKTYNDQLLKGKSLDRQQSEEAMEIIVSGKAAPEQVSAFLTALKIKGETAEEVTGFVKAIRKSAINIESRHNHLIDVCGTGGDSSDTFNISTVSAFVIAGAGIPVAKHGNRAVSSRCGSADVLQELGVKVDMAPDEVKNVMNETALGFLFAPVFHPAMKNVAPVRKALGFRTVFNILGPLCNPANIRKQIIGVYDIKLLALVAEVLVGLGMEEAMVISSDDGMDEFSLCGSTSVAHVKEGKILNYNLSPEDFGLKRCNPEELKGGNSKENAVIMENILKGETGPKRDIVVMNAAAALKLTGMVSDLKTSVKIAEEAINSGKAYKKLEELRRFS